MATVDTVYTVAGGAWFQDTFNGVAAFFNSSAAGDLLAMATVISVGVAVMTYIRTRDLIDLAKWAGFYVLVVSVLIGVKRDVQIVDLSNPAAIYQVDNVPAGIAVPATLITRVGVGLAQVYDTIFARPDTLTYTKTGMLFGAGLSAASSDFTFTDADEQQMFSDYVHNCVVGDIMLNHKYSFSDLMASSDPWALVLNPPNGPSPLRGLYDKSHQFLTCAEASEQLKTLGNGSAGNDVNKLLTQVNNRVHGFTDQIFGGSTPNTHLFTEMLSDSYNYFHHTSLTSTDIIRKNIVLNGLRRGLNSFASDSGDTAGLVNVASETSLAKMRMSQATSASIATYTLPIIHTVLLGMIIALFPILIVLAVISSLSFTVLKGYIYSIAYLQMWPILFSILNHAMNFYLSGKLGGTSVTLSNADQIQSTYSDIGTTAGWLALSIPFIAWGMVKGLGQVMSQAGNYLGQSMQSAATQSSSQTVDGTWAFNTMTHDNVQGNKWDTNFGQREGHMSMQTASGGMSTLTASGQRVFDTTGAMSKLATHVGGAESQIASLQAQARESLSQSQQHAHGYQSSIDNSWQQLQQFSQQFGNSASLTKGSDTGESSSVTKNMSRMMSLTDAYAKSNNLSREQAYNELMNKSSRGTASAGAKISGSTPKLLGFGLDGHAGIEFSGSTGSQHGTQESHSQRNDNQHNQNAQLLADFRQARDAVASVSTKVSGSEIDNNANSHTHQFAASLNEAQREYDQYTDTQTRSHEYSELASWAQDHRAQIDQNYDQQFVDYVSQRAPGQAEALLSDTASPEMAAKREQLAQTFVQERVLPQLQETYRSGRHQLGEDMDAVQSADAHTPLRDQYTAHETEINGMAHQAGIAPDVQEHVRQRYDHSSQNVADNRKEIDDSRGNIEQQRGSLKSDHEKNKTSQDKGMNEEREAQKMHASDILPDDWK